MIIQQYTVNQHPIQTLLTWVQSGEIAIPEIQRPFVWNSTQVRDLLDSLFRGYPTGYLIIWRNHNVRLKDGTTSTGKRILIDGQQRITALMTALLGIQVVNKDYRKERIVISFHPVERKFEVFNSAIRKDRSWISDISTVFSSDFKPLKAVKDYCLLNDFEDEDRIYESIDSLRGIVNNPIGLIELHPDLDIETVTEIFIRINSAGTALSQADFAMSKISVNEKYGGDTLRKAIDYFCHLAVAPEFFPQLGEVDKPFKETIYYSKIAWLQHENDDLYDPTYTDLLRVAFTSEFKRGRLEDLVALLSGRNFETKDYEESIAEEAFQKLKVGVLNFMNENNFKRLVLILRSAGFVDASLIRSQNAANFAYVLYLILKKEQEHPGIIERLVSRWYVLSVLTSRYSGSPESQFHEDIRRMQEAGTAKYIHDVIQAELSDTFWELGLPQQLNTSSTNAPVYQVYLAAQVKMRDRGFLSKDILVHDLIVHKGDLHHIFPKEYLKRQGFVRGQYNQVANLAMTQSEINIALGAKPPSHYFQELLDQCSGGKLRYGGITQRSDLEENFRMNSIPEGIEELDASDYERFLDARRRLMALKIRDYFQQL